MSRTREATPSTVTQVESRNPQSLETDLSHPRVTGTLRLRGEQAEVGSSSEERESRDRRIRWAEDVVDNEGLGKKSSKGQQVLFFFLAPFRLLSGLFLIVTGDLIVC